MKKAVILLCCFIFFNWSSGFVFLQLHSRNYVTQKLDTANVLTFGINRLLLIALSQMCVNCFLFHTHGCKIYPIISGVMSIFCVTFSHFWKSDSEIRWYSGLGEQILVAQHLKFLFHLPAEMLWKAYHALFKFYPLGRIWKMHCSSIEILNRIYRQCLI